MKSQQNRIELVTRPGTNPGFFFDIRLKTQGEKTKAQAQKTQNSRIFCPKFKIPAIFSEIQEDF